MQKDSVSNYTTLTEATVDTNTARESLDQTRLDLLWEDREEAIVSQWTSLCSERSGAHRKAAQSQRTRHRVFGALAIFTPIIFSGVTQYHTEPAVTMIGFVLTGLTSAMNTFFNFSQKMTEHFDYAARYEEMGREISVEVCKPRRFRGACDVFMARCEMKLNALTRNGPTL